MNLVRGHVIRGKGFGHTLGFPTANLELQDPGKRPEDGIYACWVKIGDEKKMYQGALHVGPRPAVGDATSTVEVHILDFPEQDLLERTLAITLVQRLRDVKNFDSLEQLKQAIAEDCEETRRVLSE